MNIWRLSFVVLVVATCGCGGGDAQRHAVHGTVTVDGTQVDEGKITFIRLGEHGGRATAVINQGEFRLSAEHGAWPGEQIVQIEAYRASATTVAPAGYLSSEQVAAGSAVQYLPAKFNTQSELKCVVEAGNENQHNFDLKLNP